MSPGDLSRLIIQLKGASNKNVIGYRKPPKSQ